MKKYYIYLLYVCLLSRFHRVMTVMKSVMTLMI